MSDNVARKESKRWVAPKNSYDGDDWGNDDYGDWESSEYGERTGEFGEQSEEPSMQLPRSKSHVHSQLNSLDEVQEEIETAPVVPVLEPAPPTRAPSKLNRKSMSVRRKAVAIPATVSEPVQEQPAQEQPVQEHAEPVFKHEQRDDETVEPVEHDQVSEPEAETEVEPERLTEHGSVADALSETVEHYDDDSDGINDIYGFYENRYSMQPSYETEQAASDSTASLSTGLRSFDSGAAEFNRHHLEPDHRELDNVPEVEEHKGVPDIKLPESNQEEEDYLPQISGLNVKKHSRNNSTETTTTVKEVSPSKSLSGASPEKYRPYSTLFHEDIAELYHGSAEFLNRPISTYHTAPITADISDKSIRNMLTPKLDQKGFSPAEQHLESNRPLAPPPEFIITSASPEKQAEKQADEDTTGIGKSSEHSEFANDHEYLDKQVTEEEIRKPKKDASEKEAGWKDFQHDLAYVDNAGVDEPGNSSEDEDSHYDSTQQDSTQHSARDDVQDGGPDSAQDRAQSDSRELLQPETFILPSERNRLLATGSSPSVHSVASAEETSDELRNLAENADNWHARQDSGESHASAFTGVTSSSATEDTKSTRETDSTSGPLSPTQASPSTIHTTFSSHIAPPVIPLPPSATITGISSTVPGTGGGPQPVSAKVKRPPQVDFTALLNTSGATSETICEKIRLMRNRETEYSAGLETWLLATWRESNSSSAIFTNGMPPADDVSLLEITATAKMSNAMHTSATKTQEKLGNLGEKSKSFGTKSKSFFAKVIR